MCDKELRNVNVAEIRTVANTFRQLNHYTPHNELLKLWIQAKTSITLQRKILLLGLEGMLTINVADYCNLLVQIKLAIVRNKKLHHPRHVALTTQVK